MRIRIRNTGSYYGYFLGATKNVILMASCVIVLGVTDDQTQKLYVINLYNFTMGKSKCNIFQMSKKISAVEPKLLD